MPRTGTRVARTCHCTGGSVGQGLTSNTQRVQPLIWFLFITRLLSQSFIFIFEIILSAVRHAPRYPRILRCFHARVNAFGMEHTNKPLGYCGLLLCGWPWGSYRSLKSFLSCLYVFGLFQFMSACTVFVTSDTIIYIYPWIIPFLCLSSLFL